MTPLPPSLTPLVIAGSDIGLKTDVKPFMNADKAFTVLNNAYVWRERTRKRQGLVRLGRLRRFITMQAQDDTDGTATYTIADLLAAVRTNEPNAQVADGTITIDAGNANQTIYTIQSNGTIITTSGPYTATGVINFNTGAITLTFTNTPTAGLTVAVSYHYFPLLPVMGIYQREQAQINDEQTIWFDTEYAYIYNGSAFDEFLPGTAWAGSDSDFFWCCNYRGSTPQSRLFFATNFVPNAANPMRYTDSVTWTDFAPLVSATDTLFQARVLIPYYGRLLALNVYEGTTMGGAVASVQIGNRCRFSQIGDPTAADAWRSDLFGKGGFIDAPTSEQIVSAKFYKNTLIVRFERTTWQLRYVGEYGLPFIWERISSDFGSESTFSGVLFDQGVLDVGATAITMSNGVNVLRIDEQIPDLVFSFRNDQNGVKRVCGVRDFQRELVFWSYVDGTDSESDVVNIFPDTVLVYNYRNQTFANFRDNVTFFGTWQRTGNITWDSTDVTWDDSEVTWDDVDTQKLFPIIVSGNQQGYVHEYGYTSPDQASLAISGIDLTANPIQLTIINHNFSQPETVFLTGAQFMIAGVPTATNLNGTIYLASPYIDPITTLPDPDIITLQKFIVGSGYANLNYSNFPGITPANTATYIGGGELAIYPRLFVQTKDFNPYLSQGGQLKISYIDFLMDATESAAMTIQLFTNTSNSSQGNLLVGQTNMETSLTAPFYVQGSDIAWHRFFATSYGQFIRIVLTYSDELMNLPITHAQDWVMNAITIYHRPGGKTVF